MARTPSPAPFSFSPPPEAEPRRGRRWLRTFLTLLLLLVLAVVSSFYGFMTAIAQELPRLDTARLKPKANGLIFAADGKTVIAVLRSDENRIVVTQDRIAPIMQQAIVAIEDRRFYQHGAVDPVGLARAAVVNVVTGERQQGGSTITQQFVKNALTGSTRSVRRKLREAALAYQLEQEWSKDRILTGYLNTVFFGHHAYGVEAAARIYFDTHASSLLPWQAALLAGLVQAPSSYDPVLRPKAALERRNVVLDKMAEEGYISAAELLLFKRKPLIPKGHRIEPPIASGGIAPYFAEHVKAQLIARYGREQALGGGLRVRTTLDLRMQREARSAVRRELGKAGPQAALVAIDPRNGAVKAMVGGYDFSRQPFNLATQGRRQPGSAFKPFVLMAALEEGILPQTHFVSRRVFLPAGGELWYVRNYDPVYLGSVPLTTATTLSDNTVFAQLTLRVGPDAVRQTAHELGIRSPLDALPAIGLGGLEHGVSPLEMAHAYATIASGGVLTGGSVLFREVEPGEPDDPALDPIAIMKVEDVWGNVIDVNRPARRQVVDRQNALAVVDMLKPVIRIGTGRRISNFSRPGAGKTGTTSDYADAWFSGMTPQLSTTVWIGYAKNYRSMRTEFAGKPVAGGTYPALIWRGFTERAIAPLPVLDWDRPLLPAGGPVLIDTANGLRSTPECPRAREQVMAYDLVPEEWSDCAGQVQMTPDLSGLTVDKALDALDRVGLVGVPVERVSMEKDPPGHVIGQSPGPAEPARVNQRVTVVVSKPTEWVALPDLIGLTQRQAVSALRLAGFKPDVQQGAIDRQRELGKVVGMYPGAGDQPRGLGVTLWVGSNNPGAIALPPRQTDETP